MPLILLGLLRLPFGTLLHHVRLLTNVDDGEPYNVNVVSFSLISLVDDFVDIVRVALRLVCI